MATDDPLLRLQLLQRDLVSLSESRLPTLDRLVDQLNASAEDFKKLLDRNKKNNPSREILSPSTQPQPDTLKIGHVEYRVDPQFRPNVLGVADFLDLDEMEAAQLCVDASPADRGVPDTTVVYRAILRYHERRYALLDCLRLILQFGVDFSAEDDKFENFRDVAMLLVQGDKGGPAGSSDYWRKCIDGLSDIESYLRRLNDRKDTLMMTGQGVDNVEWEALHGQRMLLTQQHESLAAAMCYMIRGHFVQAQDYHTFLTKASHLEAHKEITAHYLPVFINGASQFASDGGTSVDAARELHKLFAAGPGQLAFKQQDFKAMATICWLSEYSSRFAGPSPGPREEETEETRSKLFFDALQAQALHFMLSAAAYFRPVTWYDPARTAIIDFLVDSVGHVSADAPRPSPSFSLLAMHEVQVFADAFITNMPDVLRKLRADEDEQRRNTLPGNLGTAHSADLALERFMVIMALAYEGDADAARDFWSDRDSNLYGFLRWASQRLPTPRVAAFCQLLRSIAGDATSANHAHRFLLEDAALTSGKLRKTHAVSWWQIVAELKLYAESLKDRPVLQSEVSTTDEDAPVHGYDEPETGIMLDAYLGLATHVCANSSDARNWILKDQSTHMGEMLFLLAKTGPNASGTLPRVKACCLDLLSAMLTDRMLEVRNGMWVSLDSWTSGGSTKTGASRSSPTNKQQYPAKQYLVKYADSAEASASLVHLVTALISPSSSPDVQLDSLPFPENLGGAHRHAGIDTYVDFTMDTIFARKVRDMMFKGELAILDLVRFNCLEFAHICLSTFNENLVLLANTTAVAVEAVMETKSLVTYVTLHPFARVMQWILNKSFLESLFAIIRQHTEVIGGADVDSPQVQAILKSIQLLNVAWRLQPTYFDIVRPIVAGQRAYTRPEISTSYGSIDEIFLSDLEAIVSIATLTTSNHIELGLECISLLGKIGASRKLSGTSDASVGRMRYGGRIISLLSPTAPALTLGLSQDFSIDPWDLENAEAPLKLIRAKAILDLLNSSLDASNERAGIAHSLLGFDCHEHTVEVAPNSAFATSTSLFHGIAGCAATIPGATAGNNVSWLLAVKRECLEVVSKLLAVPLTATIVRRELRIMDFQAALSRSQVPANAAPLWDGKKLQDPSFLLESSAMALRDFMVAREAYFEISANDLRSAAEQGSYSVQEQIVGTLLGSARGADGAQLPTMTIFELFDFFELDNPVASEAHCTLLADVDLSGCTKSDPDAIVAYDLDMAWQLLTLRKRELREKGVIHEGLEQQADDEVQATVASLTSWNHCIAVQGARLDALEAWADVMSLIVTNGGMGEREVIGLSLQGLLVVLPRLEKALYEEMDAAALLAKLTLTLTRAISPAARDESQQTANVAIERLLATYRVSLKVITDSSTDLPLRDVCYRINCAVLEALPSGSARARPSLSASATQVSQLTQNAGERLLIVITEDTFSGRGVTRVSALLFLDGLLALFDKMKGTSMLMRALIKLNFLPVLIDTSIGNVAAAFEGEDESVTTFAYLYTALAFLLRLCKTSEGAQLVLNSGFFDSVKESKLLSTDPDIGLDVENTAALREFYRILAAILRVVTAIVLVKGPQLGLAFLQQTRWSMTAVFKRASTDQAAEVNEVALGFSRLITATGFLEVFDPSSNPEKMY